MVISKLSKKSTMYKVTAKLEWSEEREAFKKALL